MTRLGKIARLPRETREELNVRLHNGEEGKDLVAWLNGLPGTQAVLAAKFGGRPISPQNLSEWKQGGYEDWRRHQEDCARLLMEMAGDLEAEAGEVRLEEDLATLMAMALARLLREAEEAPDGGGPGQDDSGCGAAALAVAAGWLPGGTVADGAGAVGREAD